jgi:tetratricopeptide (TPR) repeat protein
MHDLATPLLGLALLFAGAAAWAAPARAEALPDFDALWDYANPGATEARFRALLPEAEAAKDADYLAQLLSQIARTEGLQGRFDDAHRTLDRAEALLREDTNRARVRCLLERGRAFRSAKEPEKAKPLFLRAWDVARASALDGLAADAGHMLAITETGKAAEDRSLATLAFAEASKDPAAQRWIGTLAHNLGWTYHDAGEFSKALAMFRKELAFRLERKQAGPTRIAKWSVARALRSLAQLDEALAIQRELEREIEPLPEKDGYVYEELAEILLAQKKDADATPYFAKAHALLAPKAKAEGIPPERIERLRTLGGVASK